MQLKMKEQALMSVIVFAVAGILTYGYYLLETPLLNFLSNYPTNKTPLILLRLLYSLHLLLLVGLYVSISKYRSYKKSLEKQIIKLQEKLKNQAKENASLLSETDRLKSENTELRESIPEIEKGIEKIDTDNKKVSSENIELKEQIEKSKYKQPVIPFPDNSSKYTDHFKDTGLA